MKKGEIHAKSMKKISDEISENINKIAYLGKRVPVDDKMKAGVTQIALLKQIYFSGFLSEVGISATAKLVLIALAQHYNAEKDDMFPSQRYLATQLGISEKSVERAVKELAAQGIIIYVTKHVNRYKFTAYFFEAVKMSECIRQNVGESCRQNVGQTYNHEHVKYKKGFSNNFSGKMPPEPKSCVPSVQKTKELIESYEQDSSFISPLDFNKLDAITWLKKLPVNFRDSFFAKELKAKYSLKNEDLWPPV